MPFTFLGSDIFFINYFPFKAVTEGAWDPYLFLKQNFPGLGDSCYLPVPFLIHSIFLFLFKPLLPSLNNLFHIFENWRFALGGSTVHFADLLIDHQLFRTLFIFKIPYLIFDFATAWLLFQMLKSDKNQSILSYKLWMLNPFVLLSCYGLGQIGVISTFFVMAAIYFVLTNRKYWSLVLLSLGIMAKTFPVILLPFAILLLGDSFKERLKLGVTAAVPIVVLIVPFYYSSNAIFKSLLFSPSAGGAIPSFRVILFACSYLAMFCLFCFIKRKGCPKIDLLILSFTSALLLFYAFYIVTIRHFVLITPLLIYAAIKNRKYWFYIIIFVVTLFELRVAGTWQQWAMFSSLLPEFFNSLPITDAYLNLAVDVKYIHQLMYRLFVFSSLIMIMHTFAINRNCFKLPFIGLLKR